MDQPHPINNLVAATLAEMGMAVPAQMTETVLIKDRYFVGHKFRYEGGCAVILAGGKTVQFFDKDGKWLTTVAVERKGEAA